MPASPTPSVSPRDRGAPAAAAAAGGIRQGSALHRGLHGSQVVLKRTAVVLVYVVALAVGLVVLLLYVVIILPPRR